VTQPTEQQMASGPEYSPLSRHDAPSAFETASDPTRPSATASSLAPVLLVHGWNAHARSLRPIREHLTRSGWPDAAVFCLDFRDTHGSNVTHAAEIAAAVERLRDRTGAPLVDIVAHSMGGLATRWFIAFSPEPAPVHGPRYWSPSEAEAAVPPEAVTLEALFGEPVFPKMEDAEEPALGNAVHTYLTALPSLEGLPADERRQVAARCLQGFGAEALIAADQLVAMGERLSAWVARTYPGAVWHTEVPVTAPRAASGQWNGSVDLLLRLPGGEVVVVDHKSSPIRPDQCADKAVTFAGQLRAYRETLVAQGLVVRETWIHFPLAAVMANVA